MALEECQAVEVFEKEAKAAEEKLSVSDFDLTLSEEQKQAIEQVLHPRKSVLCLHGVTGQRQNGGFSALCQRGFKAGQASAAACTGNRADTDDGGAVFRSVLAMMWQSIIPH